MRQGLDTYRATVAELERPYYHTLLAEAYGNIEHPEGGLSILAEALAAVECTSERYYEAELWRMKGELTLQKEARGWRLETSPSSAQASSPKLQVSRAVGQEAEGSFLKAIEIAQYQQAKSLELRATVSLARLWRRQGKQHEARQGLAEIYNWFTEGFDTVDLKEAKALLEALG
jgi:predicted ATPase